MNVVVQPLHGVAALRRLEQPDTATSVWQIANSVVPYVATLALMVEAMRRGLPWLMLALAVPASGFMVRLFIIMHDCVHSSFLRSRRIERILGRILGVLVFTPFGEWRHSHLAHHATSGDLDRRGNGDMWTMTVQEYVASSRLKRIQYRLARNPLLMLLFGPFVIFLVSNRFPQRGATRDRVMSVVCTNLAIAATVVAAALTIGIKTYLMIQMPVLFLGGVWGIWLFYVQHQFEPSYWMRHEQWSPLQAALQGSSYYRLPKVLQWFSGNIGFHHVHHLRPRIPNYNLQRSFEATPDFQVARPLTLSGSLRCGRLALWDEQEREFVSFRALARRCGAVSGGEDAVASIRLHRPGRAATAAARRSAIRARSEAPMGSSSSSKT
jgi:acyl-lipid omega-6 desaturase (Delta-12 desaturase)